MRSVGWPFALFAAAMSLASCGAPTSAPDEGNAQAPAALARTIPAAPTSALPDPPAAPAASGAPVLTPDGFGPLRIGMTLAEVTAASGPDADPQAVGGPDPAQCDQFRPARAPQGVLAMMENGRLTRISLINDSPVTTDRGVGLGSTATAVAAAYDGAAVASPHKYRDAPARYLTYWSRKARPGDRTTPTDRGIVFEVNEQGVVDLVHAGGPSIQYVEGCL